MADEGDDNTFSKYFLHRRRTCWLQVESETETEYRGAEYRGIPRFYAVLPRFTALRGSEIGSESLGSGSWIDGTRPYSAILSEGLDGTVRSLAEVVLRGTIMGPYFLSHFIR